MKEHRKQDEFLRKILPEKKLDQAMNLYFSAFELKSAWLRQLHTDWSDEQVEKAVKEIFDDARG